MSFTHRLDNLSFSILLILIGTFIVVRCESGSVSIEKRDNYICCNGDIQYKSHTQCSMYNTCSYSDDSTSIMIPHRHKRQCVQSCTSSNQCSNLNCGTCSSGCCISLCITTTTLNFALSQTVCFGGPAIVGSINGTCNFGLFYNQGFCCPCAGGLSAGPCVNALCPVNFVCQSTVNYCCPSNSSSSSTTVTSIGPCINNLCPVGAVCNTTINQCFPTTSTTTTTLVSSGPCVNLQCPVGFTCFTTSATPTCISNSVTTSGPCISGVCPTGFTCDATSQFCIVSTG